MLLFEVIRWWYGAGFATRIRDLRMSYIKTYDNFSISISLRHFFSPFRQIAASANISTANTPLDEKMRIFFDDLISRFIGALMRTFVIIAGLGALTLLSVYAFLAVAWHLFAPILPVVGVLLMLSGVIPYVAL
jgi:hypothetical protein